MDGVSFIKPGRGPEVRNILIGPDLSERKREVATSLRRSIEESGSVTIVDATSMSEITASLIGDDDTAWPRGPVNLTNYDNTFEVTLDNRFFRVLDDDSIRPAESIVMPLHATSILFFTAHDRSDAWYCTAIVTCEDDKLLRGDSENPFFVWVS